MYLFTAITRHFSRVRIETSDTYTMHLRITVFMVCSRKYKNTYSVTNVLNVHAHNTIVDGSIHLIKYTGRRA